MRNTRVRNEDQNRSHAVELALALVGLLWLTHGLDFFLYEAFPKIVVRVFALALFASSAAILFANRQEQSGAWLRTWPIWVAPLLALLSILWSDAADLTLRRSTALLGSTCFGVFLALRFELEEQIRLVALCFAIIAGMSVLRIFLSPELGLMPAYDTQVWRGVFGHKNYLGRAMALGALAFLLLAFRAGAFRWSAAAAVIGVSICLASGSASAAITMAVTLAAAATLRLVQRLPATKRPMTLALLALLALIGTALAVVFADQVLSIVGRDSTLTGRSHIWRGSLSVFWDRPWLGYGYGAVWYTDRPGVHQIITHNVGFDPLTAHSGFFDLALELGIAGLLAFILPLTLCASRGIAWILKTDSPIRLWPATYLVFFLVSNVAESELLRQNNIFWPLFVATVVGVRLQPTVTRPPTKNPEGSKLRQSAF